MIPLRQALLRGVFGWGALALSAFGAEPNPFFAMDTIARGGPDRVPTMLAELGYDGLGGKALDEAMPAALRAKGLIFFNGYYVMSIDTEKPNAKDAELPAWFKAVQGYDTVLWLAIKSVASRDGTSFARSDPAADGLVVQHLRQLAEAGAPCGVRIALYPHFGNWLERFEDAERIARRVDRPDVGVAFNLCHWLRVEGMQRDPMPALREALPRLMFVTISGADNGDTRAMGWDRLIQPLDAGTYDLEKFVRQLRALPYTGPVGFQGFGLKGDERAILQRSLTAWRRFIAATP